MGFKIQKACVLTEQELGHLTVRGTGQNIVAKLQQHGAMAGEPCAAEVIVVEDAKVLGSVWIVSGNLGQVKFSTGRVEGAGT